VKDTKDCECDALTRAKKRVVLVPLFKNRPAVSTGSTTYLDIAAPDLAEWGPWLEGITIHQQTVNRTGTHAWNVSFQYGIDGKSWWGASPLASDGKTDIFGADLAANSVTVSSEFTNLAYFGLRLRLLLKVSGSAGDQAVLTAVAACRFRA
jgi:hypothetical protein